MVTQASSSSAATNSTEFWRAPQRSGVGPPVRKHGSNMLRTGRLTAHPGFPPLLAYHGQTEGPKTQVNLPDHELSTMVATCATAVNPSTQRRPLRPPRQLSPSYSCCNLQDLCRLLVLRGCQYFCEERVPIISSHWFALVDSSHEIEN